MARKSYALFVGSIIPLINATKACTCTCLMLYCSSD